MTSRPPPPWAFSMSVSRYRTSGSTSSRRRRGDPESGRPGYPWLELPVRRNGEGDLNVLAVHHRVRVGSGISGLEPHLWPPRALSGAPVCLPGKGKAGPGFSRGAIHLPSGRGDVRTGPHPRIWGGRGPTAGRRRRLRRRSRCGRRCHRSPCRRWSSPPGSGCRRCVRSAARNHRPRL